MAAYISKKNSWIRCFASFLPAVGLAALLCFLFDGSRLGPFYDYLLRRRSPPVSRELLLIDTSVSGQETEAGSPAVLAEDILEPGAATSLLYTLAELGARTLIIQVPILGLPAGGNPGEAEILYRFDEEFSLLSRNIRNLFDAIRTGSVAPSEAARYVGELVDLSEKGKDRLVSALVLRDEEGILSMEKAAAFFGHVLRPGDQRVQLIIAGEGGRPGVLSERNGYSRALPDRDGILRRIAPVIKVPLLSEEKSLERTLEHIIYEALKPRFYSIGIEYIEVPEISIGRRHFLGLRTVPVLAAKRGPGGVDTIIPLDRNEAVLFEVPRDMGDLRRINISEILAYDDASRDLRRLLHEGESLGIFQGIQGENHPGFIYDYALSLRDEIALSMTEAPNAQEEEGKLLWIETRQRYFSSLDNFLSSANIANQLSDNGDFVEGTGDPVEQTLAAIRAKHWEVLELRQKLEYALAGSFCILGRGGGAYTHGQEIGPAQVRNFPVSLPQGLKAAFSGSPLTDAEASALLANAILTGRAVESGGYRLLLLGAILSAFFTCFLIKSLKPFFTLGTGVLLILLIAAGFSLCFVYTGIWLDPQVPVAASAAGVFISLNWAWIVKGLHSRRIRQAYGPFVSRSCLKGLVRAGAPFTSQATVARAAMVAVRNCPPAQEAADQRASARGVFAFQEKTSELIKKAGGTIIGTDEETVTACFGSPLERVYLKGRKESSPYENNIDALAAPALQAVDFISEISGRSECANWHFGLDIGSCVFAWTKLSGYFAMGASVRRARTLSGLAGRYESRIIISASITEALPDLADLTVKKLAVLRDAGGSASEAFYRLEIKDKA